MKKQIWIIMLVVLVSLFCAPSLGGAKERKILSTKPEAAHYFIFELDGAAIRLLHYKSVEMIGLVSKTEGEVSALAEKSADAPNFIAYVLGTSDEILHRDFIAAQKEIRGEFHSVSGDGKIDGYSWDAEKPVFVIRIPAIEGAEKFQLKSRQSKFSNQSQVLAATAEPEIVFELNLKDFATIARDGGKQLTYKGMPLYFYKGDLKAGDTKGNGVGGVWFVAKP